MAGACGRIAGWMVLGWPGIAAAAPIDPGLGGLVPWVFGYLLLMAIVLVGVIRGPHHFAWAVVLAVLVFVPATLITGMFIFLESDRSAATSGPSRAVSAAVSPIQSKLRADDPYCVAPPGLDPPTAAKPRTILVRVDQSGIYRTTAWSTHAVVEALFGDPALCGAAARWRRMDTGACSRSFWRDVPEANKRYELVIGERVENRHDFGLSVTTISMRINDRATGKKVAEDVVAVTPRDPVPELCRYGTVQLAQRASRVLGEQK